MCKLEKDEKTYSYIIMFENCLNEDEIRSLEHRLHVYEIETHIYLNNCTNKNMAANIWIQKYGEEFRDYINTIKAICNKYKGNIRSYKDYCNIIDNINEEGA
jgi:hypothetical protein